MNFPTESLKLGDVFTQTNLIRLVGIWLGYRLILALYNVSPFHPLSKVPGPRIAAATFLYEAWFDLALGGRYTLEIKRMHEIYGPVVRINPEELHFNDVAFVDEIYAGGRRKRDKQPHFLNSLAGPICWSMFATRDHDHHRIRRSAVDKFFSRAQIAKLESVITGLADQMCDKMIRLSDQTKEPLDVRTVYSCFTSDVISGYCFGEPFGFIGQKHWEPNFKESLESVLTTTFVFRFITPLKALPSVAPFFARWMREDVAIMLKETTEKMPARIRKARQEQKSGATRDFASIFSTILDSSLPAAEKADARLSGEGFSMMAAGTETTAWTLSVITFYLLNQPDTLARLTKELQDADAGNMPWFALEKLPYLSAVIYEGLRLSYGVSARLARIAPNENLLYRGQFNGDKIEHLIPAGTPLSMSNVINHHNEDAFPDSDKFTPERWLGIDVPQRHYMESSLTAFSKGSRRCLAMNLAYCNVFIAVTALTLHVLPRASLYETTIDDVKYDHDLFIPQPKKGSKGVRIIVS